MFQFKLPDLGEGIVEAEIIRWHVREGDVVGENQVLVELLTDKASIEIPSPAAGRIHALGKEEGEIVRVGAVLVEIDDDVGSAAGAAGPREDSAGPPSRADSKPPVTIPGEVARDTGASLQRQGTVRATAGARAATTPPPASTAATDSEEHARRAGPPRMPPRPGGGTASPPARPAERARAVPAVREFARSMGVDLAAVRGTGPGGRIMRRDVEAYLAERGRPLEPAESLFSAPLEAPEESPVTEDPEDWRREPLRGIRRATARKMRESKSKAAHYTYVEEVDMTEVETRRKALAESLDEEELSPLAFIADAVVRVLPGYPLLNASLDERRQEVILKGRIHLGVATATDAGLVVPVIRDAHLLDLRQRAEAIRSLAIAARDGTLRPEQLRGSTFTISSLGRLGGLLATPIINYPETAILGVHAIRVLPRYVGEEIRPRHLVNLSLSLDHRVVDGIDCAKMMQDVKEVLESAAFPCLDREELP